MNLYPKINGEDNYVRDDTIKRIEYLVCASFLWEPQPAPKPGPNLCTAIAFAPTYWDSPEAAKVAEAIGGCIRRGWRTTPSNVERLLTPEFQAWVEHPVFGERAALPFSCAEVEAYKLLRHYNNKRLISVVASSYQKMIDKPEHAQVLAMDLRLGLGGLM